MIAQPRSGALIMARGEAKRNPRLAAPIIVLGARPVLRPCGLGYGNKASRSPRLASPSPEIRQSCQSVTNCGKIYSPCFQHTLPAAAGIPATPRYPDSSEINRITNDHAGKARSGIARASGGTLRAPTVSGRLAASTRLIRQRPRSSFWLRLVRVRERSTNSPFDGPQASPCARLTASARTQNP